MKKSIQTLEISIFASPTFQNISVLYIFLTLTYPSRRRSFPEHPKMDVRTGVDTAIWFSCVLCNRKTHIVSDWQFEKTGWPDWSLKMLRAFFSLINFSCSTIFKPYAGTKDDDSSLPADKNRRDFVAIRKQRKQQTRDWRVLKGIQSYEMQPKYPFQKMRNLPSAL